MSDTPPPPSPGIAPSLERQVGRFVEGLAAVLALAGGVLLLGLVGLSVISIIGRGLSGVAFLGPVPGDFELVEVGTAVTVFAFLPWCQFRRGHVTVDVFLSWASPRARAVFTLAGNVLMTFAAVFIAWRLQDGLAARLAYAERTMILQMPVWYGYAAALVGAWAFALVALYTVWRSLNEVVVGSEPDT